MARMNLARSGKTSLFIRSITMLTFVTMGLASAHPDSTMQSLAAEISRVPFQAG